MRAWAELELRKRLYGPVSAFGMVHGERAWRTGRLDGWALAGLRVDL